MFPLIEKIIIIVYYLSLQLTHKDSLLHYKIVKVIIHISNFINVIFDNDFLDLIIINSSFFYHFKTYHCYTIFSILNTAILLYFISKLAILSKSQIATSKAYF